MSWRRFGPVLAWAIVIFILSTGLFTAAQTGRFLMPILHWLFPRESMNTLWIWHHYIRKTGHVVEYAVLSFLTWRALANGRRGSTPALTAATIFLCAIYASIDEFHQIFVPGRGPSTHDVMLDTIAAIAMQLLIALHAWRNGIWHWTTTDEPEPAVK
jgi:hypothetical protein